MAVFAHKIVEIHTEKDKRKLSDAMRKFGMISTFPGAEQETLDSAKQTLFVGEQIAQFLQYPQNREQMRLRFPDANLSDDLIQKFIPQTANVPTAQP